MVEIQRANKVKWPLEMGLVFYLSGSVQSLAHDHQAADPGQHQVKHQLAPDAAHFLDAAADLQHLVAEEGRRSKGALLTLELLTSSTPRRAFECL